VSLDYDIYSNIVTRVKISTYVKKLVSYKIKQVVVTQSDTRV